MSEAQRTANAEAFVKANARSPVVMGSVISHENGGAHYTLKNNQSFVLTAEECRTVEPRWDI